MKNVENAISELAKVNAVVPVGKRHRQILGQNRYQALVNLLESFRSELEADGKLLDNDVDSVRTRQREEIYKDCDMTPYQNPAVE